MDWIYLSPHLDDVVFSCGGLLWDQAVTGQSVSIWTICAGDAPPGPLSPFAKSLHERWQSAQDSVAQRRSEDLAACRLLNVAYRHFPIPDCIYRKNRREGVHLYASEESLFGPINPLEAGLPAQVSHLIDRVLSPQVQLICPLALGGHVDHRLVRAAAGKLSRPLWYYADFPYLLKEGLQEFPVATSGLEEMFLPISARGLEVWKRAVAAYTSQTSTFWHDRPTLEAAIETYYARSGCGIRLWRDKFAN
jgi:LmbE family N-acetylglucosaminyl deacetylase